MMPPREQITLTAVALLSLLPLLLHQQSALVDARLTHGLHHRLGHRQPLQPHRLTPQRGGWRAGDRWCRDAGLGGLAKLSGTGDDEEADRLAERASVLPVGCYWIAATSPDDVGWLLDNQRLSQARGGGCICVLTGGAAGEVSSKNPRLHLSNCHRQLPFLCQLTSPSAPVTDTRSPVAATSAASVASTKKLTDTRGGGIEFMSDEAPADPDEEESGDQTVDHGKFHVVPNLGGAVSKSPDGHPFGWLPPWRTLPTTRGPAATTSPAASGVLKLVDVNATSGMDQGGLRMLMEGQRSEFVTLIVLYTIVGVVCCVLLALCVIRCCRGYCGKSKIRYVKQVDADYIPRFMPSSWA